MLRMKCKAEKTLTCITFSGDIKVVRFELRESLEPVDEEDVRVLGCNRE